MRAAPRGLAALLFAFAGFSNAVHASNLDTIGVTLLRTLTTNVNGAGVRVAQPEASLSTNSPIWEVNPTNGSVEQPVQLFTYSSTNGSATDFPNSLGAESGHADSVATNFYGKSGGVATNVAHVDNYEADYFYNSIINPTPYLPGRLTAINDAVVNQSFIFNGLTNNEQQTIDSAYDNYAAQFNTLFVSGIGNGGPVNAPATCYNGIGVGAYGGSSSVGPTLDNGRAKPDITAPAGATSFSTPQVAGAAALLIQAGLRGDGGSDTNAAADIRTVKALLLNGAVKPDGWTNIAPSPLDKHYGAGVLNVFNSYEQLAGGEHGFTAFESVSSGSPHPPTGASGTVGALSGWDFDTVSSSSSLLSSSDGVNEYFFDVTNGVNNAEFTATVTLAWNRPQSHTPGIQSGINNLDLFLYAAATGNLVACSTSLVDNVEHIWVPRLPPGRYDLQVLKHGESAESVSSTETYALAWEFFSTALSVTSSETGAAVSWPVYPAGFVLESATNLVSPVWNTNNPPPAVTNGRNVVRLDAMDRARFFRLRRP